MKPLLLSIRQITAQPSFVIAVAILAVAALGLNGTARYLQLNFQKRPVPLPQSLEEIPRRFGHWVQVSLDDRLNADFEAALGTEEYVFRDYVDERIVGAEAIAEFEGKSWEERKRLVARLQSEQPEAVVNLAVTYYTGMVDTVAHIPDRCYIAGGYQPSSYEVVSWPNGEDRPEIQARFINFEDQSGFSRIRRSVAYFFHCNGRYQSSPLGVRRSLQNLLEPYGYYAKIELMTLVQDQEQSAEVMADFLAAALPEIEAFWPDWENLDRSRVRNADQAVAAVKFDDAGQ